MIGLKRRVENIERSSGRPGRLLIVSATGAAELKNALVAAGIERGASDTVLRIHGPDQRRGSVEVYEPGLAHLLSAVDGRSQFKMRGAGPCEN